MKYVMTEEQSNVIRRSIDVLGFAADLAGGTGRLDIESNSLASFTESIAAPLRDLVAELDANVSADFRAPVCAGFDAAAMTWVLDALRESPRALANAAQVQAFDQNMRLHAERHASFEPLLAHWEETLALGSIGVSPAAAGRNGRPKAKSPSRRRRVA